MSAFSGKKILLGITGSIAAYKSALIIRLLIKEGAEVKVVMTKDATGFITPLTLATLSKNKVVTDLVDDKEMTWNNHVELGLWADVMLIAPASANTIARFAHGLCDNLLSAVYLSARCPVIIAPAMDEDMWKHPATQRNIAILVSSGNRVIPVDSGELASGLTGPGRMAEPPAIADYLAAFFAGIKSSDKVAKPLSGKKALVTAGPTYEAIDPVRFIGNHSSGKMGIAIAEALAGHGASVELILGPASLTPVNPQIKITRITTAHEMYEAVHKVFATADITVMAAAVADYTPEFTATEKIKKGTDALMKLTLVKTEDILKSLGEKKQQGQILVGFALETTDEIAHATEKLRRKNLDLIVLNSLNHEGAGFQHDTNRITIIDKQEQLHNYELKSKQEVAGDIVTFILKLMNPAISAVRSNSR
ncbi:MAG TPA: bifunctional phosphopantothenoylcysteine decarboxylase/phosphopantothenate--cysteine ligase CoaBC [Chitinophagales bacterium]|nr:bifunctional phosphopantothenoylcysteine decarboxylase/phosphopantothenate--cysteine ligase CoaBC [Chitinophagales bacterium]